jgi:hypothetical protein
MEDPAGAYPPIRLPPELVVDAIFLVTRDMLIGMDDMAVVLGHLVFIASQRLIRLMDGPRRGAVDRGFTVLLVNAGVHLIVTGMIPIPLRLGMRAKGQAEECSEGKRVAGAMLNDHRTKLLIPNLDWLR